MTEIHELFLPFIDDVEDDSELTSMQKDNRTKGGETIHLTMAKVYELVPVAPDQNEDDSELASKQEDNHMKGGETIPLPMEEIHDHDERNSPNLDECRFKKEDLQWIKHNIKMRKCKTYIPSDTKSEERFCKCGYPKGDHPGTDATNNSTGIEWKYQDDTDTEPTNAHGLVSLYDTDYKQSDREIRSFVVAHFARVDIGTDMSTMLHLMTKVWEMETPSTLISVTGGEGNFEIKSKLKHWFQRNLVEAASIMDAWIITGGTHTGVAKYVGDAFKNYRCLRVPLIGIVPWGVIHNRSSLQDVRIAKYSIGNKNCANESFLDPHHSHFIMVDDGTQHKYGTEITFRAQLEQKITEMKPGDGNADWISLRSVMSAVPTVMLVLNGGPSTLEMVQGALKRKTPVVIFKGSGGAADLLADTFRLKQNIDTDNGTEHQPQEDKIHSEISSQMKSIKFCSENDIGVNIERIKSCLAEPDLLHIFERNSDSGAFDLQTAMLKAVMKKKRYPSLDMLGLALVWDKFDMAKNEICKSRDLWKVSDRMDNIIFLAIQMNRVNFLELFPDDIITVSKFLTNKRLIQLYSHPKSEMSWHLLDRMYQRKDELLHGTIITLKMVGELLEDLLGEYRILEKYQHGYKEDNTDAPLDNPIEEIFIWSVLNNQQEMAKFFCGIVKNPTETALVASALFSAISCRIYDEELIKELQKNARDFTDLALKVVHNIYWKDEKRVQFLLTRKETRWAKTSCIEIAVETKNQRFISQIECKELFTSIWNGKMKKENRTRKLLICSVFPPLIPLWATFKKNGDGDCKNGKSIQKPKSKGSSNADKANANRPSPKKQGAQAAKCLNIENFCYFYKAPVVKFCYNVISYVVFLCLYSYILLCQLKENWTVQEFILIGWVFTICTEEIRQMCTKESYFRDGWNTTDILMICLFATGMVLRLFAEPKCLEASRVILGVDLIIFSIRLLHMFSLHKDFGPKLVMIIETLQSMISFLVILMVFIVAYAIASHAILYPNAELKPDTLIDLFLTPYWNMYGELMLDKFEENANDCPDDSKLYRNGTYSHCLSKSGKYFGPFLMAVYMLISNTLLLNLLIIMFNNTYTKIQTNIDMYWNLQLLRMIDEYQNRPILPPPFIILQHAYQLICFVIEKIRSFCQSSSVEGTDPISETKLFFSSNTSWWMSEKRRQSRQSGAKKLVAEIDILQKQQQTVAETIDDLLIGEKRLEKQIEKLEKQIEKQMEKHEDQMKKQMQLIEESLRLLRRGTEVTDD